MEAKEPRDFPAVLTRSGTTKKGGSKVGNVPWNVSRSMHGRRGFRGYDKASGGTDSRGSVCSAVRVGFAQGDQGSLPGRKTLLEALQLLLGQEEEDLAERPLAVLFPAL